jgi:hypothetical protein
MTGTTEIYFPNCLNGYKKWESYTWMKSMALALYSLAASHSAICEDLLLITNESEPVAMFHDDLDDTDIEDAAHEIAIFLDYCLDDISKFYNDGLVTGIFLVGTDSYMKERTNGDSPDIPELYTWPVDSFDARNGDNIYYPKAYLTRQFQHTDVECYIDDTERCYLWTHQAMYRKIFQYQDETGWPDTTAPFFRATRIVLLKLISFLNQITPEEKSLLFGSRW